MVGHHKTHMTGSHFWQLEVKFRDIGTGTSVRNMTLILSALADHVDTNDSTFISIKRLAALSKMSERTARTCLKNLEDKGFITRTRRRIDDKLSTYVTTLNRTEFEKYPYLTFGPDDEEVSTTNEVTSTSESQETVHETVHEEKPLFQQPETEQKQKPDYSDEFTDFWKSYPRNEDGIRPNKKGAYSAWNKLTEEQKQFAMKEVQAYFIKQDREPYTAHASTWLNRLIGDWNDEPEVNPELVKAKQRAQNPSPMAANSTVDRRNVQQYTSPPRRTLEDIEPMLAMYGVPVEAWQRWCKAYKIDIIDTTTLPQCAERWKNRENREANTTT